MRCALLHVTRAGSVSPELAPGRPSRSRAVCSSVPTRVCWCVLYLSSMCLRAVFQHLDLHPRKCREHVSRKNARWLVHGICAHKTNCFHRERRSVHGNTLRPLPRRAERLNNHALRRGAREALEQLTRALERRVGAGCGLGQREAVEGEHGGAAGLVAHEVEQRVTRLFLH